MGADPPVGAPGSGQWIQSTDDVLAYARYIDQLVVRLNDAVSFWQTDPPGCPAHLRCIIVLAQWNHNLGAMGPWDYWHERWTNLLRDLETSYWARVSEWDALVDLHRELLSFLAQARALGLPHVPDDLPMPTGPTGPGSTLGDLGGALDKGGQHIENILGKLLIGGAIVGAVLIAREFKK
jgi:hypothetical protein